MAPSCMHLRPQLSRGMHARGRRGTQIKTHMQPHAASSVAPRRCCTWRAGLERQLSRGCCFRAPNLSASLHRTVVKPRTSIGRDIHRPRRLVRFGCSCQNRDRVPALAGRPAANRRDVVVWMPSMPAWRWMAQGFLRLSSTHNCLEALPLDNPKYVF